MMPLAEESELAVIAITRSGAALGARLAGLIPGSHFYVASKFAETSRSAVFDYRPFESSLADLLKETFPKYRKLVLFVALGAAVRLIAPLMRNKKTDPAVVVVDDAGKHAVSVLSGHIGGANTLARDVARLLGAQAVVTTGSDVLGALAPDMIGRDLGWTIENDVNLTDAGAACVNGEQVGLYQDAGELSWWTGALPANVTEYDSLQSLMESGSRASLVITDRLLGPEYGPLLSRAVVYRPKSLVVGVGCNRGAGASEVGEAIASVLDKHALSLKCVRNLATIDIKGNEEGILEFARRHRLPIAYYTSGELDSVPNVPNRSEAIRRIVGTGGVCEPASMLSARATNLVAPKSRLGNVTVALARIEPDPAVSRRGRPRRGAIFVIGLGPGAKGQMTLRASQALAASDVVVGYKTYLNLIRELLSGKEVISSGMRQEVTRARKAVEMAGAGKDVAVVSSGDAGVYGMAGLVYEVAKTNGWESMSSIEVVPGVSALNAAAALLGAPLMHDFSVISLSDLLTPWDKIVRRLRAAGEADFVVVLYNPKSGRRTTQIEEARNILLECRNGSTPVGLVTNAYRPGQGVVITDLDHMLESEIGMLTTVVVGNSQTAAFDGVMVTPRGYEGKYELGD